MDTENQRLLKNLELTMEQMQEENTSLRKIIQTQRFIMAGLAKENPQVGYIEEKPEELNIYIKNMLEKSKLYSPTNFQHGTAVRDQLASTISASFNLTKLAELEKLLKQKVHLQFEHEPLP